MTSGARGARHGAPLSPSRAFPRAVLPERRPRSRAPHGAYGA
ncbi:hypothetical protein ACFUTV_23760 [Streptomyces sp. NPDC057298]